MSRCSRFQFGWPVEEIHLVAEGVVDTSDAEGTVPTEASGLSPLAFLAETRLTRPDARTGVVGPVAGRPGGEDDQRGDEGETHRWILARTVVGCPGLESARRAGTIDFGDPPRGTKPFTSTTASESTRV